MSASRIALIVASEQYDDPKLSRLRAPAHDASALAQILADESIGQFDVNVLVDESEAIVRRKIDAFFQHRQRDDLLLLHFSCHGVKDDEGHLYFAMPDTDMGALDSTAVSAEFVERQIRRSRSRRVVLLLDCCYSGAFARGTRARAGDAVDLRERFEGRGRAVITASSSMEYAFEGDELTGAGSPSVFTEALVRGLRTGEADRDEDGLISIDELYDHVYDEVRERTPKQTPGKWSDVEGRLIIARSLRPVVVKPVELPPELHSAMENHLAGVREGAVHELSRLVKGRHAGLALSARRALEHLCDDDSRRVSGLAAATLAEVGPPEPSARPEPFGPIATMLPARDPVTAAAPDTTAEVRPPERQSAEPTGPAADAPAPEALPEAVPESAPLAPVAGADVGTGPVVQQPVAKPLLARPVWLAVTGVVVNLLAIAIASARNVDAWSAGEAGAEIWVLLEVIVVPVFLLGALATIMRTRRPGFALGLMIGFATQLAAAYLVNLLGFTEPRTYAIVPFIGAVLICVAVVICYRRLAIGGEDPVLESRRRRSAALMLAGAMLVAGGLFVGVFEETSIYRLDRWYLLQPLTAAAGLVAMSGALLALPRRARLWAGVASGLAFPTLLLLLSFVAVPVLFPEVDVGSWAPLGPVGAALAIAAGAMAVLSRGVVDPTQASQPAVVRPVFISAAGAVVALMGLAVASTRSSFPVTPLSYEIGGWMWELLQYVALPAVMLLALAGVLAVREGRELLLGVVAGFGTVSLSAYAALIGSKGSLTYEGVSNYGGAETRPALHAVVPALGMAIAVGAAWVAYARLVRSRQRDELSLSPPRPALAFAAAGAVAAMAIALFVSDVGEIGTRWVLVEPISAMCCIGIAGGVFWLRGHGQFWAGVLLATGVQMTLFFLPYFAVPLAQTWDVELNGGALGVAGAAALVVAVLDLLRRPATSAVEAPSSHVAPI